MNQTSVWPGSAGWSSARFAARPKFSVLLWSGLLAAAIPLTLAFYWLAFWLAPESVGGLLRISVLADATLLGFLWYRAPRSHAEVRLFRILGVVAVVWLIPALLATDRSHAIGGWAKLLILFAICCLVARGLRHPPTAHVFGLALLASGILLVAFILFTYVHYLGFILPTYKSSREFKGVAQEAGLPLNSIAFCSVFSYLMGLCLVRTNRTLIALGIPLLAVSSAFTGSRAPLAILAASLFVLVCFKGFRSTSAQRRLAAVLLAFSGLVGGTVIVLTTSDKAMNQATEGRSHLWSAAAEKFLERPLFGFGYESWRDDLVSRLPGEHELTFDLASRQGGGYHNQYLSILAEEGLLGAVAAALVIWLLLRSSWLLAFHSWATVRTGQWPFFAAIFLLLRANFEVPGLFGYGQEPVDYLAYLFLAILMSRFSVEEDYARSLAVGR